MEITCHLNISACDVKFSYSPDLEFIVKSIKNQPFWHLCGILRKGTVPLLLQTKVFIIIPYSLCCN